MSRLWLQRAQRLWLVVVLPIMLVCFGQAYLHYEAEADYRARAVSCKTEGRDCPIYWDGLKHTPTEDEFLLLAGASRENDTAQAYLLGGLAALVMPPLLVLAVFLARWVWFGSRPSSPPEDTAPGVRKTDSKTELIALAVGGALTLVMFFMAPARTLETLVSTLVQAVVLVVAVWLYRRFKR